MVEYIFYLIISIIFLVFIIKYPNYILYIFIFSIQFENALFVDMFSSSISKLVFIIYAISFTFNFLFKYKQYAKNILYNRILVILFLLSMFYIFINVLTSINFKYSVTYLKMILQQIIMIILISSYLIVNEKITIKHCFKIYSIASIIVVVIALYKMLSSGNIYEIARLRISAFQTRGEEAHFAAALIPSLSYLLYLLYLNNTKYKIIIISAIVIISLGLLFSQTRSAWLAALFLILFYFYLRISKEHKRLFSFRYFLKYLGFIIIIVLIISVIVKNNSAVLLLAKNIIENRTSNAIESGGSGRTQIWKYGIEIAKFNLIFGSGFMSFPEAFSKYYQSININGIFSAIYAGRDSHNIFLSTLVEGGIVGSSIYLSLYIYIIINVIKSKTDKDKISNLLIATFFAFLIVGFFLTILNRKYYWIFIAFMIAFIGKKNNGK